MKRLCCGRGYQTRWIDLEEKCNCRFVWCCHVQCDICKQRKELHLCNWSDDESAVYAVREKECRPIPIGKFASNCHEHCYPALLTLQKYYEKSDEPLNTYLTFLFLQLLVPIFNSHFISYTFIVTVLLVQTIAPYMTSVKLNSRPTGRNRRKDETNF